MIHVVAVPPEFVEGVCNHRRDILEKAAEATFYETPDSLVRLAIERDAICWAAIEGRELLGVVFTQILISPKRRTLIFLAFGGEQGARWIRQAREVIEAYAKAERVDVMSAIRIGGKKTCLGMKPKGIYYEEAL